MTLLLPKGWRLRSTLMGVGGRDWAPSRRSPGTRQRRFYEISFEPRKLLGNAATPTIITRLLAERRCRVYAVLGVLCEFGPPAMCNYLLKILVFLYFDNNSTALFLNYYSFHNFFPEVIGNTP